jgi:hypothetical protein
MRTSTKLKRDSTEKQFTIEEIKRWYLEEKGIEKFEMIRTEIINLARQIQVWLAIASAKKKFKKLKYEDFWGWTQQIPTLRLIAIDGVKICGDTMLYVKSVIENNVGSKHCMNLIKNSRLPDRLKSVRKIIEPLKPARNKRYAHFENQEIEEFKCNLQDLLITLINLDNSLGFISHYLLNPRYLISEEWDFFSLKDATEITESSYLIEYLENDRVIRGCNAILHELNEIGSNNLTALSSQEAINL